jgi:hypothetical protein
MDTATVPLTIPDELLYSQQITVVFGAFSDCTLYRAEASRPLQVPSRTL